MAKINGLILFHIFLVLLMKWKVIFSQSIRESIIFPGFLCLSVHASVHFSFFLSSSLSLFLPQYKHLHKSSGPGEATPGHLWPGVTSEDQGERRKPLAVTHKFKRSKIEFNLWKQMRMQDLMQSLLQVAGACEFKFLRGDFCPSL